MIKIEHIPGEYKAIEIDLEQGQLKVNDHSVGLPLQALVCPKPADLQSLWASKYRQLKTQKRSGAQRDLAYLLAMADRVVKFQDFCKLVSDVLLSDNRSEALKSASGKNPDDSLTSHTRVRMDLGLQLLMLGCGLCLSAFGTRRSIIRELLLVGEGKREVQ